MPKIATLDGTKLYVEESGIGTLVVFVHEYAGDYRSWEPQMRFFNRQYRCITFSQRGYPPLRTCRPNPNATRRTSRATT